MSSTADILKGGMAAMASGQKVDSNTVGALGDSPSSDVTVVEDHVHTGESSADTDMFGNSESDETSGTDTPAGSPAAGKSTSPSKPGTKEVITVTDETGKRRKVEIDYSDRKAIKKAYEMMSGARKWQAERDQARKEAAAVKQTESSLKKNWDILENTFKTQGEEGVLDLLAGKRGAFQDWQKKAVERARFLEQASPEEIQALQAKEHAESSAKELVRIRKENEEFRKEMTATKEQAELRSLESQVNPVFDKYRFADKLGDATDEHMFDEMLWNTALKRLEPYEAQGLNISQELVEREFRAVANAIRKRVGLQAEKKVVKALNQKKQEATENVQAKVMSGYKTGGVAKEAKEMIDSRNLTGLIKNWNKFGGLFNK